MAWARYYVSADVIKRVNVRQKVAEWAAQFGLRVEMDERSGSLDSEFKVKVEGSIDQLNEFVPRMNQLVQNLW